MARLTSVFMFYTFIIMVKIVRNCIFVCIIIFFLVLAFKKYIVSHYLYFPSSFQILHTSLSSQPHVLNHLGLFFK